jgi:hypothetical protein
MPEYVTSTADSNNRVLAKGDYDFFVADAGEKRSTNGNPMIELQLVIKNGSKAIGRVYDHLVFTDNATWKIDDFRRATGEKLTPGQKVNFEADDCISRKGRCTLTVDNYQGRMKNKVEAYLDLEDASAEASKDSQQTPTASRIAGGGSTVDPDDIPFACDRG